MTQERKPTIRQWLDYKKTGGRLSYHNWLAQQSKPSPPGALTPYAQWLTTTPEYAARKELMARGGLTALEKRRAQEALDLTTKDTGIPTPAPEGWEDYWDEEGYLIKWDKTEGAPYRAKFDPSKVYAPPETPGERARREREEAETRRTEAETGQVGVTPPISAGEQARIDLEREELDWKKLVEEAQRRGEEVSEARRLQHEERMQNILLDWQREQAELQRRPTTYPEYGINPYDVQETPGVEGQWNPYTGQWEAPSGWIPPYQQETLGLQKQQMAQEEAYRQAMLRWQQESQRQQFAFQKETQQAQLASEKEARLAQLRANPASWLEYASLAGRTPRIQPWMMPLMPGQYPGLQAGAPIPGYQAGGQTMNLPELVTPSAQYMSRISPTARQQYYGYEGARTGQTPSDVDWRLWSQAPPGGRYTGLSRTR